MFEAFQIGPITLWMRTVLLLIAISSSTEFFFRLARSAGLSLQDLRGHARWFLLSFFLGGRLVAILAQYQTYIRHLLRVVIVWDGNFSFLGGAIGVAIFLFILSRTQRATFLQWLDVLLPATTFGLAIDWLGMFLSATAYGKPTNMPWGITVNTFSVRYSVPIHPVQLYYCIFFFVLTFILLIVRTYSRRAGAETLFGIVIASLGSFCFEFFRGDFAIPVFAMFTDFLFLASLIVSLGVLAALEHRLTDRATMIYGSVVAALTISYIVMRPWIDVPEFQLRFSQLLAVLALLVAVVYVVVHRAKHPHL